MNQSDQAEIKDHVGALYEDIQQSLNEMRTTMDQLHAKMQKLGQIKRQMQDSCGKFHCMPWKNVVRAVGIDSRVIMYATAATSGKKKRMNPRSLYNLTESKAPRAKTVQPLKAPSQYQCAKLLRKAKAEAKATVRSNPHLSEQEREDLKQSLAWAVRLYDELNRD